MSRNKASKMDECKLVSACAPKRKQKSPFSLSLLVLEYGCDEEDDALCDPLWAHGPQDKQLL